MKSSFAWTSVLFFLASSSLKLLTRAQVPASEGLCACPFAADNEKDCSVYGANPDGDGLVAYPRIGDECIENIGARSSFLSALDFWIYCPYRNGTNYNLEYFFILLRDDTETPEAQYVMSQFIKDMDFDIFQQNADGTYDIVDVIINNKAGGTYNCTEKEKECWNQAKAEMKGRYPRWEIICTAWHDRIIPQFKNDQATARRKLCEGGLNETELELCHNADQIKPRSDCSALEAQVEPENSGVPLCNAPKPVQKSGAMGIAITTTTWGVVFSSLALVMAGVAL